MQYRNLGALEQVSAIGLGCMGMSEFYGATDSNMALDVIRKAYDFGVNFFDTADIYGYGENERLLGAALKDCRAQVYLATKCGIIRDQADPTARGVCTKAETIIAACHASLKRLQVEYIDLFYLHRLDGVTPIEESMAALADLVQAGKVRSLGLSEVDEETIRRAHKIHPLSAIQTEYSLWSREPENKILTSCRELGIGFVPYSPLGRGFLTGKISDPNDLDLGDSRKAMPRFQKENFVINLKLVEHLQILAQAKGCTPAQLAIAWVLAQGENIVPIPGTKRLSYLKENIAALEISLAPAELEKLNEIAPLNSTAGTRYPAAMMKAYNLQDNT